MNTRIEGGPLDGERWPVRSPVLVVPSTPIVRTDWTGENYVHTFTEHRYRLKGGIYKYEGAKLMNRVIAYFVGFYFGAWLGWKAGKAITNERWEETLEEMPMGDEMSFAEAQRMVAQDQ